MSMCLGLVTLADKNIQRLLDDPPLVWLVVAPDDREIYDQARSSKKTFLSRLLGFGSRPEPIPEVKLSSEEGESADLDKAWHGIHYLLTGTEWGGKHPYNFLASGGHEVGKIEVGYGPARALFAKEVREVHAAIEAISDEELRSRFDPHDMLAKKIYPSIWSRKPEDDDSLGYLMENMKALREFFSGAASNGVGVVLYLS